MAGKFKKSLISIMSAALMLPFGACSEPPPTEEMPQWSYASEIVEYSQYVGPVTGKHGVTDTTQWGLGGTDLGFPIYNSVNDTMYYAFGDSFNDPGQKDNWRSNTLAMSKDYDFSDGLRIDDVYKGPTGSAKPIIEGFHNLTYGYEATKIPTGGIEVDGVMYMFYMSIRQWDGWIVNYNGVVKSADNGQSWERVYDLTWSVTDGVKEVNSNVGIDINRYKPTMKDENGNDVKNPYHFTPEILKNDTLKLANQTVYGTNRKGDESDYITTLEGRAAPNFGQVFPIDGRDGYVYIFGIPGGRMCGVKLGRVLKENIEKFDEYEYLTNKDESGNPVFVKGKEGLAAVWDKDVGQIIEAPMGELSFSFNAYLNKWVSVNSMEPRTRGMNIRVSDTPWGEWSKPQKLFNHDDYLEVAGEGAIYGGLIHEKMQEQNGKVFYVMMSQWMPIYNSSLVKVVLL